MDVDPTNLTLTIKPQATATAVLSANADLWTANAGINQDLGIDVAGVGYPTLPGQPEAWEERGGVAGNRRRPSRPRRAPRGCAGRRHAARRGCRTRSTSSRSAASASGAR